MADKVTKLSKQQVDFALGEVTRIRDYKLTRLKENLAKEMKRFERKPRTVADLVADVKRGVLKAGQPDRGLDRTYYLSDVFASYSEWLHPAFDEATQKQVDTVKDLFDTAAEKVHVEARNITKQIILGDSQEALRLIDNFATPKNYLK